MKVGGVFLPVPISAYRKHSRTRIAFLLLHSHNFDGYERRHCVDKLVPGCSALYDSLSPSFALCIIQ